MLKQLKTLSCVIVNGYIIFVVTQILILNTSLLTFRANIKNAAVRLSIFLFFFSFHRGFFLLLGFWAEVYRNNVFFSLSLLNTVIYCDKKGHIARYISAARDEKSERTREVNSLQMHQGNAAYFYAYMWTIAMALCFWVVFLSLTEYSNFPQIFTWIQWWPDSTFT